MQAHWRITYDHATSYVQSIEPLPSFGGSVSGTEYTHDIPLAPGELRQGKDWEPPDADVRYLRVVDGSVIALDESDRPARDAEIAAAVQAEQAAALQAFIDAPVDPAVPQLGTLRHQIIEIEGMIDWYIAQGCPLERPLKPALATMQVNAWLKAMDAAGHDAAFRQGQRYAIILLTILNEIQERGATIEQVNAAWNYMQATGQDTP